MRWPLSTLLQAVRSRTEECESATAAFACSPVYGHPLATRMPTAARQSPDHGAKLASNSGASSRTSPMARCAAWHSLSQNVHHIRTEGAERSLRLAVAMPPAVHYFSPCEQCGFTDDGPREWRA